MSIFCVPFNAAGCFNFHETLCAGQDYLKLIFTCLIVAITLIN